LVGGGCTRVFADAASGLSHEFKVAQVEDKGYTSVIMQGAGTMALEAVVSSIIPRENAKAAVFSTGSYGRRLSAMTKVHGVPTVDFDQREGNIVTVDMVEKALREDDDITHVIMVHTETAVGTTNPVFDIGNAIRKLPSKKHGPRTFFVDSMAMFGAMELDLDAAGIDALVSSANKCIQGVPGFSFAILRQQILEEVSSKIPPRSLSLDLYDQWKQLEANGQFRYTPPTHSLLAFRQALRELEVEGVAGRRQRYIGLFQELYSGFTGLGFKSFFDEDRLPPHTDQYIITPYLEPEHENFNFVDFSRKLSDRGFVVYPGKTDFAKMFRCGHIGNLTKEDCQAFVAAVKEVKQEMGF
jgi:2-aminoethylphosphonate-pyruvate transaminase